MKIILLVWFWLAVATTGFSEPQTRAVKDQPDFRFWLENMVWYHRFTPAEIETVTGLERNDVPKALRRFNIRPETKPRRPTNAPLLVLPYPGGRHPRIGFLDGAIEPQRETKLSIFTPWDDSSYVVLDVPEAIWSNLGLTYLAHTHIDTLWTKQAIQLQPLEWNRRSDGSFDITRILPNGIAFGVEARPNSSEVRLRLWLRNGTAMPLSDLRVQMCAMLKGAAGFSAQTNTNKVFEAPFAACRSETGNRWVIQAWKPCHRVWGNAPCPCLHSDPKIPDCPVGETRSVNGWFSFYEGDDIKSEFQRIERTWK